MNMRVIDRRSHVLRPSSRIFVRIPFKPPSGITAIPTAISRRNRRHRIIILIIIANRFVSKILFCPEKSSSSRHVSVHATRFAATFIFINIIFLSSPSPPPISTTNIPKKSIRPSYTKHHRKKKYYRFRCTGSSRMKKGISRTTS